MPPVQPNNNQAATTDYGTAYGEFGNVYDPEVQQVQTQLDAIPGQTATAMSSLDQAKANAFKTNATNANARGVLFGGVIPQANQDYTTNTYTPNVQKVNDTAAANTKTLQQKITDINQERANAANSLVVNTQNAQAQAAEAAQKASASAAKSAASAAQPTTNQIASGIRSALAKTTGGDGYVSPEDYAQAYIDWLNNGQSASSFNSAFSSFKNPTNGYYDYAIAQAVKRAS